MPIKKGIRLMRPEQIAVVCEIECNKMSNIGKDSLESERCNKDGRAINRISRHYLL